MIDEKLAAQIQKSLAKEPKVKLTYVLGSTISERLKSDSDFDLAVVVDNISKTSYSQIYQLLLPLKFPKDLDLSLVDKNSSPLFLFQIIKTGKCIYQRYSEEKVFFEAYVLKNYYDTAHRKTEMHRKYELKTV